MIAILVRGLGEQLAREDRGERGQRIFGRRGASAIRNRRRQEKKNPLPHQQFILKIIILKFKI